MLPFHAHHLVGCCETLARISTATENAKRQGAFLEIEGDEAHKLKSSTELLEKHLRELQLNLSAKAVGRFLKLIEDPGDGQTYLNFDEFTAVAEQVLMTCKDELESRVSLMVPIDRLRDFNDPFADFGAKVQTDFQSAFHDIDESGKCYALGRSTASAFHAIRCLEAAIRALSRCLGIPDPTRAKDRNWGAMLNVLRDEIDRRWPGSSSRLSGDGEFFDRAYAALAAMQNPYRNSTMHLDQKYTDDEAKYIRNIVAGFMKKIASRIDEDGKPLA